MKVRKLKDGELIEIGDRIKVVHFGLDTQWETIYRVTPKLAFTKYNDHVDGKYPRRYKNFGFRPFPKEDRYTTDYSAWRPISSLDIA